jgi:SET domain-containing protein
MAFLEKELYIADSKIPGAGQGLFTKVFIPKGTRVVEYKGKKTDWKEASKNPDNPYIFFISNACVIDALSFKKAFGRYANDASGLKKVTGLKNNSEYVIDGERVFIETLKDVPAGAEILISYGKDYWDTIRQNAKLDAKLWIAP